MYMSEYVTPTALARVHLRFFPIHHSELILFSTPRGSGSFFHNSLSLTNHRSSQKSRDFHIPATAVNKHLSRRSLLIVRISEYAPERSLYLTRLVKYVF